MAGAHVSKTVFERRDGELVKIVVGQSAYTVGGCAAAPDSQDG